MSQRIASGGTWRFGHGWPRIHTDRTKLILIRVNPCPSVAHNVLSLLGVFSFAPWRETFFSGGPLHASRGKGKFSRRHSAAKPQLSAISFQRSGARSTIGGLDKAAQESLLGAKKRRISSNSTDAAERQSRNQRDIHHGGTETPRKSKSKARPESTEVAEATERSAGAMGRRHRNPKVLP